jgi:hypothetical protein
VTVGAELQIADTGTLGVTNQRAAYPACGHGAYGSDDENARHGPV